jgi:hypothetical protein
MSLDTEWRRLARASRARRALKQWCIAYPALRGLADLDALNLGAGFGARLQYGR